MIFDENRQSAIRGIVLDAVGTVIDPRPSVAAAYAEEARRQGVVLDREVVRKRFHACFAADDGDELRGPMATDESIEHRRWRRIVAGVLPEAPDPDGAFEALWVHFARPASWRVFDDVRGFLEVAEALGLAVRIVSNFDARLRGVLAGLPELAGWADSVVISSEVGYRKPHPNVYRAACSRLGLRPEEVLSVGDDLENDVLGARRAGLGAVLLDREGRHPAERPRVGSLRELGEHLATSHDAFRAG